MNGENLLRGPGEPLDTRDDPEPEWTVDPDLSGPDAPHRPGDPADR